MLRRLGAWSLHTWARRAACKSRLPASQPHQRVSHDSIVLCSSPLLGADGMMKAAKQLIDGVQQIEGLEVVGQPEMSVVAFKATRAAVKKCVAHRGQGLTERGVGGRKGTA